MSNRDRRLPVVTALLDDAMRAWLRGKLPDGPARKAEGVAQTDEEIDQIMEAISTSVDFRILQLKMEWDIFKRTARAAVEDFKRKQEARRG